MQSPSTPIATGPLTRMLLVLDVVESVRLMEQDQDDFVRRWQQLVRRVEQILPAFGGRIVKSLGDGLMLSFTEADACVQAAFDIQRSSQQANAGQAPHRQIHLRMGAHPARFVADQHDIYGTDVNLTARLCALGGADELLCSNALLAQLPTAMRFAFEDMGELCLRHIGRPVHVWRVACAPQTAGHAPPRSDTSGTPLAVAVIPFVASMAGDADAHLRGLLVQHLRLAIACVPAVVLAPQPDAPSRLPALDVLADVAQQPSGFGVSHLVLAAASRLPGDELLLVVELVETRTGRAHCETVKTHLDAMARDMSGLSAALSTRLWLQAQNRKPAGPLGSAEPHHADALPPRGRSPERPLLPEVTSESAAF